MGCGTRNALSGHQALIDFREARFHLHVDNRLFAGCQENAVARLDLAGANGTRFAILAQSCDATMRHRRQVTRRHMRFPADARVEETANQEEEEQHHRRIEIGVFTAPQGFRHAHAKRDDHRQ